MTESARATYTLSGLLDQFVLMGGPSIFGPGGLAILTALWRRSKQLGWQDQFIMSHAEITVATGIRSRSTILSHCEKLQESGFIEYTEPPSGKVGGTYRIFYRNFGSIPVQNLNGYNAEPVQILDGSQEPVQKMDGLGNGPVQNLDRYSTEPVQKMDDSQLPVRNLDGFIAKNAETCSKIEHILTTLITTTNTTTSSNLPVQKLDRSKEEVIALLCEYVILHNRPVRHVKDKELELMVRLLVVEGMSLDAVVATMRKTYAKYSTETAISSFCYYEGPIMDEWDRKQNIGTSSRVTSTVGQSSQGKQGKKPFIPIIEPSTEEHKVSEEEYNDLLRMAKSMQESKLKGYQHSQ